MGNSESTQEESHEFDGCETLGYRVLGVQPNSPAARAGLVSFFDFLVGANGRLLFGINAQEEHASGSSDNHDNTNDEYFEDMDFPALLKGNIDQEIELCKCGWTHFSRMCYCYSRSVVVELIHTSYL